MQLRYHHRMKESPLLHEEARPASLPLHTISILGNPTGDTLVDTLVLGRKGGSNAYQGKFRALSSEN